jgi:hypothetical protein
MDEQELSYEEVLEYLGDRQHDEATLNSYPTYRGSGAAEGQTLLGLTVSVTVGTISAVSGSQAAEWAQGHAAARIELQRTVDAGFDEGLVLTREWFADGWLSDNASRLLIIVRADPTAEPLHPPVGQEGDPDAKRPVRESELVGWGFAFDFDGSPPFEGRWAVSGGKG